MFPQQSAEVEQPWPLRKQPPSEHTPAAVSQVSVPQQSLLLAHGIPLLKHIPSVHACELESQVKVPQQSEIEEQRPPREVQGTVTLGSAGGGA
jgi:hypothetical protein